MADDKKTLKFQMMMAPSEAEVLDDWMFKNRIRSRAEAIRRLCQIGLAYDAQAADWQRLIKEAFHHTAAISREALEIEDEDTADYKRLHLRSLAHLVLFAKSASELARRMSSQAKLAQSLKTEDDIDALIQQQAGLRSAIEAAEGALEDKDLDK